MNALKIFDLDFQERFTSRQPVRLRFGRGVLSELGQAAAAYGGKVLIVCGSSATLPQGPLAAARRSLEEAGIEAEAFDRSMPNPTWDLADHAGRLATERGCEAVVAIGGGSAIDLGKAAAVVAAERRSSRDFLGAAAPFRALPLIAVSTLPGSGSECSAGAILKDPATGAKGALRGECLLPRAAFLDPDLALTAPREASVASGFDMLAHAVETFLSRQANPGSAARSEAAVRWGLPALESVFKGDADREARGVLMWLSATMGQNLAEATTCLPHRLQYALERLRPGPHGVGIAALFPSWIEWTWRRSPEKFERIAEWCRAPGGAAGQAPFWRLRLRSWGLPASLADLKVEPRQASVLVETIDDRARQDPGFSSREELVDFCRAAAS